MCIDVRPGGKLAPLTIDHGDIGSKSKPPRVNASLGVLGDLSRSWPGVQQRSLNVTSHTTYQYYDCYTP
jgi:hypothetical protein